MRAPVEICSLPDIVASGRLLAAFVEEAEGLDMWFGDRPEADRDLVRRQEGF